MLLSSFVPLHMLFPLLGTQCPPFPLDYEVNYSLSRPNTIFTFLKKPVFPGSQTTCPFCSPVPWTHIFLSNWQSRLFTRSLSLLVVYEGTVSSSSLFLSQCLAQCLPQQRYHKHLLQCLPPVHHHWSICITCSQTRAQGTRADYDHVSSPASA